MIRTFALVVLSFVAACGDDGGSGDALPDASGDGGMLAVAPPEAPALPSLACPPGWLETPLGEVSYCEPFPMGARGCEIGQAQMPGDEGCVPVGTSCPADGWPADLPTSDVLYVDVAAAAGGDGSRASPFAAIGDALDVAAAGTTIALHTGTYDELLRLPSGVTLRGACPRATVVGEHSPTLSSLGRIDTSGNDVHVENLRVSGSRPGLWVRAGGSMIAEGVVVDDARIVGVVVQGSLEADDLVVRATRADVDGSLGHGINVENGGALTLRRGLIIEDHSIGIFAGGAGTTVDLADVAIRAIQPSGDDTQGIGMLVGGGAQVMGARVVIEGSRSVGVNAGHADTTLSLEDFVVRGTSAQLSDGSGGHGVFVAEGATATLRRGFVAGNQHAGLSAYLSGSSVTADDLILVDTRPRDSDGGGGAGAFATMGGELVLRRAWLSGNHSAGVGGFDGARLDLADVVISDTHAQTGDGVGGAGVLADLGTDLTLRRGRLERNEMDGIFLGEAAVGTLEDIRVVDTRGQPADGLFGRGIEAIQGATVTLARGELEENRGAGLIAFDEGTRIDVTDLRVARTSPFDCAATGCPGAGFGIATRAARISVGRFILEDDALAGVQVARGGVVTLSDGAITGHPIGINVQDAPFEEGAVLDAVSLEGNDRNIDAQSLPLPEPATPPAP